MTDNLCIGGVRPADTASNVCIGGVALDRVCIGGAVVYDVAAVAPPVLNPGDMPWANMYESLDTVIETALVSGAPFTSITATRTGGEPTFPAWLVVSARPDGLGIRATGSPPASYVNKIIVFSVTVCNSGGCIVIPDNQIDIV